MYDFTRIVKFIETESKDSSYQGLEGEWNADFNEYQVLVWDEEKVLENELIGYKEYKGKVKYKLIPYLW